MTDQGQTERLHPDDKRALKHFMTGQIRNVLANEFGVGGKKAIRRLMTESIRAEAQRLAAQYMNDRFVEQLANDLIRKYYTDRDEARRAVERAIKEAANAVVGDVVRDAAKQIQISFNIAPAQQVEGDPQYGRF